jgi:ABC-type polysaccharide/polyol phosphate export permease
MTMTNLTSEYDSWNRPPRPIEEWIEFWRNPGVLRALVARNLKVRYRRSVLGVLWTLLNPAAMLLVLWLVFAHAFSSQTPRYPAYVFPGLVMWNFFSQTALAIVAELAAGVELWRRVRMPKTALAAATAFTGLINLGFALAALLAILVAVGQPLGAALLTVPVVALCAFAFVLGFSLIAGSIALRFPDIADVLAMVLTGWMFATPVIYPLSILAPRVQRWLWLNPMTLYVEAFRAPLYRNVAAPVTTLLACAAVGVCTLAAGWILFAHASTDSRA